MRDILTIVGLGLVGYGLFQIYQPLTYLYGGAILILLAYQMALKKQEGESNK